RIRLGRRRALVGAGALWGRSAGDDGPRVLARAVSRRRGPAGTRARRWSRRAGGSPVGATALSAPVGEAQDARGVSGGGGLFRRGHCPGGVAFRCPARSPRGDRGCARRRHRRERVTPVPRQPDGPLGGVGPLLLDGPSHLPRWWNW